MSTTAPSETTPPEATPVPPTPPAPPAVVPVAQIPASGNGPWSNDLATMIEDPTIRATVDQYMRDKVQPHTTQLEQQVAQSADAVKLWEQLNSDPVNTYVAMTTEMFGEEAGQKVLAELQQVPQADPAASAAPQSLDPRVEAALSYIENEQETKAYATAMAEVAAANPELDTKLLEPFILAANNDFTRGIEMYNGWIEQLNSKHSPPPADPETAPAALGSDTQAASATGAPTQPRKESIGEAIEGFMADQRANREAPPVSG